MWPIKKRKIDKRWAALVSAGIALGLIAIAVFSLRLLSGNEDAWLCINGSWVKHGNPSGPPTGQCGPAKAESSKPVEVITNNTVVPVSNHKIKITSEGIDPPELEIDAYNSVTWVNEDSVPRPVKPITNPSDLALPTLFGRQPDIGPGGTFTIAFPRTGTFEYSCGGSPPVTGKIIIE